MPKCGCQLPSGGDRLAEGVLYGKLQIGAPRSSAHILQKYDCLHKPSVMMDRVIQVTS